MQSGLLHLIRVCFALCPKVYFIGSSRKEELQTAVVDSNQIWNLVILGLHNNGV